MDSLTDREINQLGRNIRRLRKGQSLNQAALAYKAGTRSTTISLLENGLNKNPGMELLGRIADVLQTSIHQMTQPETTDISDTPRSQVPEGLVELLREQDKLLSPMEDRISFSEGEWLQSAPVNPPDILSAQDYLLILRQLRQLVKIRFPAK